MTDFRYTELANTLETTIRDNRLLPLPATWSDEVIFPAYAPRLSLVNVIHSLAEQLGAPFMDSQPLAENVWGDAKPEEIQRVVLVLLDGTGYLYLKQLIETDPVIAQLVSDLTDGRGIVPLTTVAPSTTAVALTSLWTGATPGQTAITGTQVYLRELSMLINVLFGKPQTGKHPAGIIEGWGFDTGSLVQHRGLAQHLAEHDIRTHLLLHRQLTGTGLSKILHRGVTDVHTHIGYSDMIANFQQLLQQTTGERTYINFYVPSVDSLGHEYGSHTPQTVLEIKQQLQAINTVLSDEAVQDGQTLFMLLADHGHHDAPHQLNILEHPAMADLQNAVLIALAGDGRLGHMYIRDGKREAMKNTLDENFSEELTFVDVDAAIDAGFYGDVNPIARRRMGDLLLIPRLNYLLVDDTAPPPPLIGWHSGMDAWEMLIPFIWRRL